MSLALTPHFQLGEFIGTSTGLPNFPAAEHICALRSLCSAVLEPWRERIRRPIGINSGYRSQAVNDELRRRGYSASPTSQHLLGEAADVEIADRRTAWLVLVQLATHGLPVDEAIVYEDRSHIHVSHTARWTARRELLVHTAAGDYVPWSRYRGPLTAS